jgi:hypothetical protein
MRGKLEEVQMAKNTQKQDATKKGHAKKRHTQN